MAAVAVIAAGALSTSVATGATLHHARRAQTNLAIERGAVIARDPGRHTLVIASHGVVHTLRLASARQVISSRLGVNVLAHAVHLVDGTYRVVRLAEHGRSHRAVVRATVVEAVASHLLLSAGGSVFAVGNGNLRRVSGARHAHATSSGPTTGEVVNTTLQIGSSSVQSTAIQPVGQATLVDLQGVLTTVGNGSLVVAATAGADTTVTIPASISLPSTIAVGDQVEITAAYSAGTFSLVTIVDDTLAASMTSQGVTSPTDGSADYVEIEGIVVSDGSTGGPITTTGSSSTTSLTSTASTLSSSSTMSLTGTASTLVIQPGDGAPVTITVPSTMPLPPLSAGTRVHAVASMVGGTLTLVSLHVQMPEGDSRDQQGSAPGQGVGANQGTTSQPCLGAGPNGMPGSPGNQGGHNGGDHAVRNDRGGPPLSGGTCSTNSGSNSGDN